MSSRCRRARSFGTLHIFTWMTPVCDVLTVEWYGNEPADQKVNEYVPDDLTCDFSSGSPPVEVTDALVPFHCQCTVVPGVLVDRVAGEKPPPITRTSGTT